MTIAVETTAQVVEAFGRTPVNVGMIGRVGHGKIMLTAAIIKYYENFIEYDQINKVLEERKRRITIVMAHIDCLGLIMIVSTAMLIVSEVDGPMLQMREYILLARQVGVGYIVVYINKADVSDNDMISLVKMGVKQLLSKYEFSVIMESVLKTLEKDGEYGKKLVSKLIEKLDEYVKISSRIVNLPFLLLIEDVFLISGRRIVVTERIKKREIIGLKAVQKTTFTNVKVFKKLLKKGSAGLNVRILLRGTKREEVERGQILAKLRTIMQHRKFKAEVYVLKKGEVGRYTPFFMNYQIQSYLRTTDVMGSIRLIEGKEIAMSGVM